VSRSYNLSPEAEGGGCPSKVECISHCQTIAANDRRFIIVPLLNSSLNWADPTDLLFQLLLGMAICLVDGFGRFSQIVKVAELMGYAW